MASVIIPILTHKFSSHGWAMALGLAPVLDYQIPLPLEVEYLILYRLKMWLRKPALDTHTQLWGEEG